MLLSTKMNVYEEYVYEYAVLITYMTAKKLFSLFTYAIRYRLNPTEKKINGLPNFHLFNAQI